MEFFKMPVEEKLKDKQFKQMERNFPYLDQDKKIAMAHFTALNQCPTLADFQKAVIDNEPFDKTKPNLTTTVHLVHQAFVEIQQKQ